MKAEVFHPRKEKRLLESDFFLVSFHPSLFLLLSSLRPPSGRRITKIFDKLHVFFFLFLGWPGHVMFL